MKFWDTKQILKIFYHDFAKFTKNPASRFARSDKSRMNNKYPKA